MRQPETGECGRLDAGHFLALYEQHQGTVYRLVRARGADPLQAEDITAQTFLQALQAFPRFDERGVPAVAWLRRIATNVLTDQARRDRRDGPLTLAPCPQEDGLVCRSDTPEQWMEARERAAVVRRSLGVCWPRSASTVAHRMWHGCLYRPTLGALKDGPAWDDGARTILEL